MSAIEVEGFPTPNFNGGNYSKFTEPNCTWYCYGRAREIAGKTLTFKRDYNLNGKDWYAQVSNAGKSSTPTTDCIACFDDRKYTNGHVAYVYGVEGPANDPYIIFSDSNWSGRSNLKAYSMPKAEFENMCGSGALMGYLTL